MSDDPIPPIVIPPEGGDPTPDGFDNETPGDVPDESGPNGPPPPPPGG